ncbi:CAAX protease family [Furfurilactobacillus rossiae]|uniref:CPBP family intramembrane glutamic endopeptidase n=1 Tax=Furfurilactobacillus rossiae TaxID=231049 RepID=UPI0015B89480|nr:type II CAAX endopeptidase family protein [Furfurilactobacillus rossiae]MCF6166360.1 CPBP family intramembrane metalloprotease [Furfurilactobacillus rossiae]QLE65071.1 CAAX protease family [Furfurilactobacillus rossiae]
MKARISRYVIGIITIWVMLFLYQTSQLPVHMPELIGVSESRDYQWLFIVLVTITSILFVWLELYTIDDARRYYGNAYIERQPTRNHKWLMFGIMVLILIVFIIVQHFIKTPESENQKMVVKAITEFPILNIYGVVVLAPIIEELLFRRLFFVFFFKGMDNPWIRGLGIITNGLFFASVHTSLFSPGMWVYTVMGMLFATTYVTTKNVKFSIALHMLNNLVALFY